MLCDTCQRQQRCLPRQLADQDPKIQILLQHLHQCGMRIAVPSPSFRTRLQRLFRVPLSRHRYEP